MSSGMFVMLGAVFAAGITGLVSWLVSRRGSSGKINTSDAATLWQESQQMRRELRDQVSSHMQRLDHCIEELRAERERARNMEDRLRNHDG